MSEQPQEKAQPGRPAGKRTSLRRRSVYLLPNAFTTAALFCGFYAIVIAMNRRFDHAAAAIFIAMILDGLDGRVARITNTQSEFGSQYDSLADMVSFGVAPALVIYEWALIDMGKWGWVAAFVYCSCAALRLARFNTNIGVVDKSYFQGLPSPSAAALVAGLVLLFNDLQISVAGYSWASWAAWGVTFFAGLTMISNVPFYSFKSRKYRKSVPYASILLFALVLVAIVVDPPKTLFTLVAIFTLSGFGLFFWRLVKGKPVSLIETDITDHEDELMDSDDDHE